MNETAVSVFSRACSVGLRVAFAAENRLTDTVAPALLTRRSSFTEVRHYR